MSKTIFDYTAATGIDPSADYLLIEQAVGPVYKKINQLTLLGITGSPVGTSDSQALSNKTIGNTNTITLKDTLFTLQDDGDTSKQARFQLSGITTATTRTYTLPNASVTLASLTGTETLTNKTITSPIITGGTYDNGTITVDSISGHSTSTIVTVAGVQMNNGTIGTSGAVTSTSIAAGAVQPQALVAGTGTGWAWQTWTPTFSNLTTGNGVVTAKYTQIGKTVIGRLSVQFGSTTSMGTAPGFSLPVTSSSAYTSGADNIGTLSMVGGGTMADGFLYWASTTTVGTFTKTASGSYVAQANITASVPIAWATGYYFLATFTYEAA